MPSVVEHVASARAIAGAGPPGERAAPPLHSREELVDVGGHIGLARGEAAGLAWMVEKVPRACGT